MVLGAVFYVIAGLGVTAGFHRYFTHGAYKAKRWLEITMAVAACLSLEMPPIGWVAEHRRHHQFSDEENDPHSPWRFGTTKRALTKGFVYSHMGWLFNKERTNPERFAPDLLKDPAMVWLDKHYGYIVASASCCLLSSAGCGPGAGKVPLPPSSGRDWCAFRSCTM